MKEHIVNSCEIANVACRNETVEEKRERINLGKPVIVFLLMKYERDHPVIIPKASAKFFYRLSA